MADAAALLDKIGPEAVKQALAEPAIVTQTDMTLDIGKLLRAIVTDEPYPVEIRSEKAIKELADLNASAARVESEPFWVA